MLPVIALYLLFSSTPSAFSYSMYVWREGYDTSVLGCTDPAKFLAWDTTSTCFTHTWSSPAKREWLWSTCNNPSRKINTIYLYGTKEALATRDCANPGVQLITTTLAEGRSRVPGLNIYALFSDGGRNVPEQNHIPNVVWYNSNCGNGQGFAGVAVNNEDWDKDWSESEMIEYLNNLNQIKLLANQQNPAGSLKTHFSVGWHWGQGPNGGDDIYVRWGGKLQPVMRHFIDIFDSLDVQAAFVTGDAMEERVRRAEWNYSVQIGKPLAVNAYMNKAYPCQTTFFPFSANEVDCPAWSHPYKTEIEMFRQLDLLQESIPGVKINLHHFRGCYSSGGFTGWPRH